MINPVTYNKWHHQNDLTKSEVIKVIYKIQNEEKTKQVDICNLLCPHRQSLCFQYANIYLVHVKINN